MNDPQQQGELARTLGVADAVVIGAGSMIGAGVFAAWAPAAQAAGAGLILGLLIAGVVAFCNATSSAQLAALHPESGGTYVYARKQLNAFLGHVAGWGFVVGKTASCVAMALTLGAYVWPAQPRIAAVAAVVGITAINIGGLTRTVAVTRVLLLVSLSALVLVVVAGWTSSSVDTTRLDPSLVLPDSLAAGASTTAAPSVNGVLRSAGLLFFAFAGYARIATLGEEVREPRITIPKAVPRTLVAVFALYAVVGVTLLVAVQTGDIARSNAPLRDLMDASRLTTLAPVVGVAAGIASLGVLLNLIPGVSRTILAMARRKELPGWLAHISASRNLPLRAELLVAAVIVGLVLVVDLRSSIAVSGVAVLTYYALTNASALTLNRFQRRWPKALAVLGLVGCAVLIAALPTNALIVGFGIIAAGMAVRAISVR